MSNEKIIERLKETITAHPNFPKDGIIFRDFFPILRNPDTFESLIVLLEEHLKKNHPDLNCVAGIEARGFLLGTALALKLKLPFVPLRKPGKLPGNVKRESYSLEYGTDGLEIQTDALKAGEKVVVIDDLIATGGSMEASIKLIRSLGCEVALCVAVIELTELKGREKISAPVYSVVQY